MKYDPANSWLIDYMNHDFSARGLNGVDGMLQTGMGFATASKGSDTMITIPGIRYYHPTDDPDYMPINSVNASEHSVTTTMIFTVGELKTLEIWLKKFDKGILSFVADTFDLTEIVRPDIKGTLMKLKEVIKNRDGKLVIRPDSNPDPLTPVEIICGWDGELTKRMNEANYPEFYHKGLVQCLWEIFGGTTNEQGLRVLDPTIGAIYGDAISLERQVAIYQNLVDKKFAPTNIVLGVGSYTLQMNTRDTVGMAFKGSGFWKADGEYIPIYKEPITDDGTKTSPKGLQMVYRDEDGEISNKSNCTPEEEELGLLEYIVRNGKMVRQTDFETIRKRVKETL